MTALTVGITTRNRPASLKPCVTSLRLLDLLTPRVVRFDDASDPPVAAAMHAAAHHCGGYREGFVYYGEEKDFCLRLLESGERVVYLPQSLVGRLPDPSGRDVTRYVRYAIRNDCLSSLYNDSWPIVALSLPLRVWRYRKMKASLGAKPGGLRWIAAELAHALPDVWRDRRAVSWSTFRTWRRLARVPAPYAAPGRS